MFPHGSTGIPPSISSCSSIAFWISNAIFGEATNQHVFCSELVAAFLRHLGCLSAALPQNYLMPGDFFDSGFGVDINSYMLYGSKLGASQRLEIAPHEMPRVARNGNRKMRKGSSSFEAGAHSGHSSSESMRYLFYFLMGWKQPEDDPAAKKKKKKGG